MKNIDALVPGKIITVKFSDWNPENCRTSEVVFVEKDRGIYRFAEQIEKSEGAKEYLIGQDSLLISDEGLIFPNSRYATLHVYGKRLRPIKEMLIEAGLWDNRRPCIKTDNPERAIYLKNKLEK